MMKTENKNLFISYLYSIKIRKNASFGKFK